MTIALFYGGKSCEHEVSIITGIQAGGAIEGHEVVPVYIDREGEWKTVKHYQKFELYRPENTKKMRAVFVKPNDNYLYIGRGRRYKKIDCALICCHGAGGEDGCLQGVLRSAGIPFTGCDLCASAIGMDKAKSKVCFASVGLNTVEGLSVNRSEYENDLKGVVEKAKGLGKALIVKPASLGSSIAVSRVGNAKELILALNLAFEWDNAVIIERALDGFSEFNCAVLGDGDRAVASMPEKPTSQSEILSYADKYERGGFKGATTREFPAKISDALTEEIRSSAIKAFNAVGASGVARVDFLYDGETLFVNEINTIPGSLSLYLFPDYEFGGKRGGGAVIERLIALAKKAEQARERLRYRYTSPTIHAK